MSEYPKNSVGAARACLPSMSMAGCAFLSRKLIPHSVTSVVSYFRPSSKQMEAQRIDALQIGFTQPELVDQDTIMVRTHFALDAVLAPAKRIDK